MTTHRLPLLAPLLATAIAGCPDQAVEQRARGNIHLKAGRVDEALTAYTAAIQAAPDHAGGHFLLGNALQEAGRTPAAIREYEEALRLGPDATPPRRELGIALFHAGRHDEARAHFEAVLERDPTDVFTMNRLAEAYAARAETGPAEAMLTSVLQRHPDNRNARLTRARMRTTAGDLDGALATLQDLRRLDPAAAYVAYEIAAVRLARGERVEAMRELTAALQDTGGDGRRKVREDTRFRSLAGVPEFEALVGIVSP